MGVETVRGKEAVVIFDGRKCIHPRNCILGRPDVFVPNVEGDWIFPDNATVAELAELAHNCPSGAIRCTDLEGNELERAPVVNTVRIRENGPLTFHAPLTIAGKPAHLRATLCRCGASKHKPFCDGSHTEIGFDASGEATVKESDKLESRDGPLEVNPLVNGPLHVIGNLEVVSGTGTTLDRVTDVCLCRCGHSQNKPFCDGSHRKVGFKSEE